MLKYKYKFEIYHLRGKDLVQEAKDKGKLIDLKNNTIHIFRLFKLKHKKALIDPIPLEHIGFKNRIKVVEIEPNHFVSFSVKFDRNAINKYNTELNLGTSLARLDKEREAAKSVYGALNLLEKWLPLIQIIGIGIILIGGIILLGDVQMKQINAASAAVAPTLQSIAKYNENLDKLIEKCMGTTTPPSNTNPPPSQIPT